MTLRLTVGLEPTPDHQPPPRSPTMRSRLSRLAWIIPAFLLAPAAIAGEVGFIEDFALARDRTAALRQLIPGTEDYYFYHALHYLNTEQFEKAEALIRPWHDRL